MLERGVISTQTLKRLPTYLNLLRALPKDSPPNISATSIAEALKLNDVQVRKDLSQVSDRGRPKVGYSVKGLTRDIEEYLGYGNTDCAVLAGVGNLGRALMTYAGFREYGLEISAAFDCDERVIGKVVGGREVMPIGKLTNLARRMNVLIGVITTPAAVAQEVADAMVAGGVRAIWNFAPTHLLVPENVILQNENLLSSLAVLSKRLSEKLEAE